MDCGYGEKLILYFYGEAAGDFKAGIEAHLKDCAPCRGQLAALTAAEGWLKARPAAPSDAALEAVLELAREACRPAAWFGPRSWTETLLAGALTAALAVVFSLSAGGASPGLAWNTGLDSGLDSVEYSIYQEQADLEASQGDWEYSYALLEAESRQEG